MGNTCITKHNCGNGGHNASVPLEAWQQAVQSFQEIYPYASHRYHHLPRRLEDDYVVEAQVLGTGMSGCVRLARGKHQEGSFAVKTLSTQGISPAAKRSLALELQICLLVDHPLVVRVCDVYEAEGKVMLVMECMEGGELFDRLVSLNHFPEHVAAKAIVRMLVALKHLHHENIMHGDLKLENFMYAKKDDPSECVKLTDFGLSKIFTAGKKLNAIEGTLAYLAPEALSREMGPESDLWSLGVIAYALLSGSMPFVGSDAQMMTAIRSGKYSRSKLTRTGTSQAAQDFVEKLLVVHSQKRLTVEQALNHPWISNHAGDLRAHHACRFRPLTTDLNGFLKEALISYASQPLFRRIIMHDMAWCLSYYERKSMGDVFWYVDPTHQGRVSLRRIEQELQGHLSREVLAKVMNALTDLDADNDGEIGYTALLSIVMFSRVRFHERLLCMAFRRLDEGGTGYLTRTSLKNLHFRDDQVKEILRQGDLDGDGRISLQDFESFWNAGPLLPDGDLAQLNLFAGEHSPKSPELLIYPNVTSAA